MAAETPRVAVVRYLATQIRLALLTYTAALRCRLCLWPHLDLRDRQQIMPTEAHVTKKGPGCKICIVCKQKKKK